MRCPRCGERLYYRGRGDHSSKCKWLRKLGGVERRRGRRNRGWESLAHAVRGPVPLGPEKEPGWDLVCGSHVEKKAARILKALPIDRICQTCARMTGMNHIPMGVRRITDGLVIMREVGPLDK